MADPVRALFDSFTTEEHLRRLVEERREENLYLEYKEKHDRRHGNIDESDRKNCSKTLSAFANAAGGVLIFGIASEKARDAPDHATDLKPITGVAGFRARLQDSVLTTTQPVVDDVEFRVIPSAAAADAGYVVCLVPQSDKPPHRAMHADREYYRKTASGSRKLDHLDLEDMFGRRPRPLLRIHLELQPRPGIDPYEALHLSFSNEGRAVARYAGLLATMLDEETRVADGRDGITNATALNGVAAFQFIDNVGVIHPNGLRSAVGHAILLRSRKGGPLKVRVRWYCDGMQWKSADLEVAPGVPVDA